MIILVDKSEAGYLNAIANVQALGTAQANPQDIELTKIAAKQYGSKGDAARKALGKE